MATHGQVHLLIPVHYVDAIVDLVFAALAHALVGENSGAARSGFT